MSDKINIDTLRSAVEKKMKDLGAAPIKVFPRSRRLAENRSKKGFDEAEALKQNLFQLAVYSAKLHDMLNENQVMGIEDQNKIVEAASKISEVYHLLEYKVYKKSK